MVVLFMLYHYDKNKIKIFNIYEEKFNDDRKKVREVYIRDKIIEEYLFLKSIDKDKEKIAANKKLGKLVNESFFEKYQVKQNVKYEGVIMIDNQDLFFGQKNVFWRFYEG
jgi:hypothetical protein